METRTPQELKRHYEIEKRLASKLRNSNSDERKTLYSSLYEDLYFLVPDHPQLTQKSSPEATAERVRGQMKFLKRYLGWWKTYLEVGPGDCALAIEVAKHVEQVYAVDVSETITKGVVPKNFKLLLSDGTSIPVHYNHINVAYSDQLMEHLHPDDALEQLNNIYTAISHGGKYICITPNRLSGPHDISKHFDLVATGFHMQEYTTRELIQMFKAVGFRKCHVYIGARGIDIRIPHFVSHLIEWAAKRLPKHITRGPFRVLLGIKLVGIK